MIVSTILKPDTKWSLACLFQNVCNAFELLLERFTQLERINLNNAQYNRIETLEINPVPSDITDNVVEQSACQALSLTGVSTKPDNLQACRCMRKIKSRIIVFFQIVNFTK